MCTYTNADMFAELSFNSNMIGDGGDAIALYKSIPSNLTLQCGEKLTLSQLEVWYLYVKTNLIYCDDSY